MLNNKILISEDGDVLPMAQFTYLYEITKDVISLPKTLAEPVGKPFNIFDVLTISYGKFYVEWFAAPSPLSREAIEAMASDLFKVEKEKTQSDQ